MEGEQAQTSGWIRVFNIPRAKPHGFPDGTDGDWGRSMAVKAGSRVVMAESFGSSRSGRGRVWMTRMCDGEGMSRLGADGGRSGGIAITPA